MATSEGGFKTDFFGDISNHFTKPKAHVFALNDRFHSGYPDRFITYGGLGFAVEAKFVKAMPRRPDSNVLGRHDLTPTQARFLDDNLEAGGVSLVLVGFRLERLGSTHETAIAIPYAKFRQHDVLSRRVLEDIPRELWFIKDNGHWGIEKFFEKVMRYGR